MRATLSRTLNSSVSVPLTLTPGTAEPDDYGRLARITIPANSLTGSGRITTVDDADSDDETFTIALGNLPPAVTAGSPPSVTVTINDRTQPPPAALPVVSITAGPAVTEGGSATFTVHATPTPASALAIRLGTVGNVTFVDPERRGIETLTVAANTSSAVWRVATIDDDMDEPDGSVTAALRSGTGYTVGSPRSASVTVIDNDTAPLPVVSFSAPGLDVWDTDPVEMVEATLLLSIPAPQPLTINLGRPRFEGVYSHPSSISVAKGETSATVRIIIHDFHSGWHIGVWVFSGDGYIVGELRSFYLNVYHDDRPQHLDPRCPYPTHYPLLDRVSSAGTLCATSNRVVSQTTLDRVSRASSTMLQHRPDLARILSAPPDPSAPIPEQLRILPFVALFGPDEDWCTAFPVYVEALRLDCDGLFFQQRGVTNSYFSLCPENDFAACVHHLARAIWATLGKKQWDIRDRFNEPDVSQLWNGFALADYGTFFTEMTTIYFCVNTRVTSPEIYCADALKAYDPATYEVIHGIYRGSADLRRT